MLVRTYLMLLVLGCAACGISLYIGIKTIDYSVEVAAAEKSQSALRISDFRRLEESFSQWLVLADLVLGSDETYLSDGAIDLGEKIRLLTQEIQLSAPDNTHSEFTSFSRFNSEQIKSLQAAAALNSEGREAKLDALLTGMDEGSINAIQDLQTIKEKLNDHQQQCDLDYANALSGRGIRNAGLLLCFALSVAGLWIWISQIVSRPISQLSEATRQAMYDRELNADPNNGPQEVQLLTMVFSELFSDLTDQIQLQKKTQSEREALYERLVDTSRRAGMAEVATGVLHNVGNVLNSVKVSACVALETAQKSLVAQLQATNNLIASQGKNLGEFITLDSRGQNFPEALDFLSNGLATERDTQMAELETLVNRIDYIDEIVKSQQVFAKAESIVETIQLNELIEHAIGIKRHSLNQAGIVIVREFSDRISIKSEKHRLLQIIVNLITNAIEAIQMGEENQKEITIQIEPKDDRMLLSVIDTGIGITNEDLGQLFAHGFTTKEEGHGFGLHSSAIAAAALNAHLSADSDGLNRGATFVLDLPLKQEEICKV